MGLEDVILRIGRRAREHGVDAYLFGALTQTSAGISLKEKEPQLLRYLKEHPQSRYFLFGLGGYNAWKRVQNPLRTEYNGVITSIINKLSPSPALNLILLKLIGVRIENPPKTLPESERNELRTGIATNCQFDCFFPELVSIGYGTLVGLETTLATHVNQGEYWIVGTVEIGNNVLIGAKSVIGPVKIGNYAKINAGSYLITDVPEGVVFAGNPARKVVNRNLRYVELDSSGIPRIRSEPAIHR